MKNQIRAYSLRMPEELRNGLEKQAKAKDMTLHKYLLALLVKGSGIDPDEEKIRKIAREEIKKEFDKRGL